MKRLTTVLRHHWLLVAGLTTVVVVAAWFVASSAQPLYRASALLEVQTPLGSDGSVSLQDTLTARERAVTIAALGDSGLLYIKAEKSLTRLAPHTCGFSQVGQSEFVESSCTGPEPRQLALAANTYAVALRGLLEAQREARIAELTKSYQAQLRALRAQGVPPSSWPTPTVYPSYRELQLIDPARTPTAPYAPKPLRTAAIALVLALLLNIGLAFGLESLQNRARSVDDLSHELGEPVLGTVPILGRRVGQTFDMLSAQHGPLLESPRAAKRGVAT